MAVIETDARLSQGVIVNAGAVVDHDVCIDDFAHLGVVSIWLMVFMLALQPGCNAGYGVSVESGDVVSPGTSLQAMH